MYRIGTWESLFPNAEIKYIHLTRGFAQTINGLMDGWQHPPGFHSYDMETAGCKLHIKGYKNSKWWKFDLPPNWKQTINLPLEQVCLNQWLQANRHILREAKQPLTIKFEDFLENPDKQLRKVSTYLGIKKISSAHLPKVMTTVNPKAYRWHKRKSLLLKLSRDNKVKFMMNKLNYSMNPKTWK